MAFESTAKRIEIRDRLVGAMLAVSIDGMITHEAIATIIGKDTTSPDSLKNAAFRIVAEDSGVVFENVRNVGYKRIHANDAHRIGHHARHYIRNKSRKSARKINSVLAANSNSMGNPEKIRAYAEVALLGVIQMSAGRGAAKRAEDAAAKHFEERQTPPSREEIAKALLATKAA